MENNTDRNQYIPIIQPTRCTCYFKLFKTLYMFRTVFPSIIRSSKLRSVSSPIAAAVWHIPLLYTQFWAVDDGRKDRPKYVEHFKRINNLR